MANKFTTVPSSGSGQEIKFFRMSPVPMGRSEKINYFSRTGINNFQVWRAGYRGEPFEIETFADFTSVDAAWQQFHTVYQAIRGTVVDVTWEDGYTQNPNDIRCVVLNCQPVEPGVYKTLCTVGGLVGARNTSGGILKARWSLLSLRFLSG